jgi:hypothetical protein
MNRNRGYSPRGGNPYHYSQPTRNQNNNLIDTIHELIVSYNENIRTHNQIIEDYNHNVFNILNILQHIQGNINVNNYSQANANNARSFPTPGNTNSNRRPNNIDLSALLYLLNIPVHVNYESETRHIVLTQEQIDNSTTIVNYNNENFTETTCPISLDDFEVGEEICKIVGCGHYFKKNHIMRWFQNNHICPVCRYNILGNHHQHTTTTNNTNNTNDRPTSSENITGLQQSAGSPLQTRNNDLRIPIRNRNSNTRFSELMRTSQDNNGVIVSSLNTSNRSNISDNNFGDLSVLPLRNEVLQSPPLHGDNRASYDIFTDISSEPNLSRRGSANIGMSNMDDFRRQSGLLSENSRATNDNEAIIENVSRIIGDIILEQIPNSSIDPSNNLMFSFEIPIPYRSI